MTSEPQIRGLSVSHDQLAFALRGTMSLVVFLMVISLVHGESPSSKLFGSINYRIGCLNPAKIPGFCVEYESCPGIKAVIPKHDPKFILQALSDHTCGFNKGKIYVCCPRSLQTVTTTIRTTTEEIFGLESIETSVTSTLGTVDFRVGTRQRPAAKLHSIEQKAFSDNCICPPSRSATPEHKNLHLLSKNCGIMSGSGLQLEDHPWTVLLRLRLRSGSMQNTCVGVLISSRYVLTAGHCVKNGMFPPKARVDQVRVGEYDQGKEVDCVGLRCSPQPKDVKVEESIVHPGYSTEAVSQDNDIALIRLKTPVVISEYVRPICLPDSLQTYSQSGSENFWSVGWGSPDNTNSFKSKAKLSLVPIKDCALIYKDLMANVSEYKICAGIENDDESCQSGSPLMTQNLVGSQIRWFIQGVFSLTPTACGTPYKPSIFTNVFKYRKWILDNMRE